MKSKKKVCVLCIDGLEYDIVHGYGLKNLLQKEYGKVELPIKEDEDPKTPIMWTAFFTGKPPADTGVDSLGSVQKSMGLSWRIQKLMKKIGVKKMMLEAVSGFNIKVNVKHDFDTLFDKVEKNVVISMPNYNEDLTNFLIRNRIADFIEEKYSQKRFDSLVMRAFKRKKKMLLDSLGKEWDLLAIHFFFTDAVCHAFFDDEDTVLYYYSIMDKTVKEIASKIDDDTLLVIVSDHGCKRGLHTDYGFYSLNEPRELNNPKLTDFHDIILNEIGGAG